MKTFKCVFLSSTQSGPNPFWKGALHIQNQSNDIIVPTARAVIVIKLSAISLFLSDSLKLID